eukprot:6456045-Amphidinium_carterae.1
MAATELTSPRSKPRSRSPPKRTHILKRSVRPMQFIDPSLFNTTWSMIMGGPLLTHRLDCGKRLLACAPIV